MSLDIDPAKLTEFATQANHHATTIGQTAQPMRLSANSLGTFSEATTLVDTINTQIEDVRARLTAVSTTLTELAGVATDAASLATATDSQVAATMTRIKNALATVDLQQAAQAQKDRDEAPPPIYGGRKPMAF